MVENKRRHEQRCQRTHPCEECLPCGARSPPIPRWSCFHQPNAKWHLARQSLIVPGAPHACQAKREELTPKCQCIGCSSICADMTARHGTPRRLPEMRDINQRQSLKTRGKMGAGEQVDLLRGGKDLRLTARLDDVVSSYHPRFGWCDCVGRSPHAGLSNPAVGIAPAWVRARIASVAF